MVYERVRGWPSGRRLPVLNVVKYPPLPGVKQLPIDYLDFWAWWKSRAHNLSNCLVDSSLAVCSYVINEMKGISLPSQSVCEEDLETFLSDQ